MQPRRSGKSRMRSFRQSRTESNSFPLVQQTLPLEFADVLLSNVSIEPARTMHEPPEDDRGMFRADSQHGVGPVRFEFVLVVRLLNPITGAKGTTRRARITDGEWLHPAPQGSVGGLP